jgi:hypothetical protein
MSDQATADDVGQEPALPAVIQVMADGVLRDATPEEIAEIEARQAAVLQPPIPQQVTMRQARLALLGAGKLSLVDAAIDSLESPEKEAARIEWDYSSTVERSRPLVVMLGQALGLDEEALDQLFITAAGL